KKRFGCTDCELSFEYMSHLKRHKMTHRGERPFGCKCGARFNRRYSLQRHEIIHTEERSFSCSTCGRTFRQKDALKGHEKIHTKLLDAQSYRPRLEPLGRVEPMRLSLLPSLQLVEESQDGRNHVFKLAWTT
ncbi:hypothetical protein B0J13DRAFT_455427, partial [Dactylonectria estremocensis]